MKLYDFQKQAIAELQKRGKHICIAGTGAGKGSIALHWLKSTGKKKWLFVTTASKRDSKDVENEALEWFGEESLSSISLTVISWAALAKWTLAHWSELKDWAIVFDEIHLSKAGVSSNRGRAFIQIAKQTDCWTGYTATPGDRWEDFQAYFVAAGYVKNKTAFMREFCQVQTFKGYPEIVGYYDEHILKAFWKQLSVCPDTQAMLDELPAERHKTCHFKPSPAYKQFLKDHLTEDGVFIDTCFVEGTLVDTLQGKRRIEEVKIGDKVWSYNIAAKRLELKTVERLVKNPMPQKLYKITLEDEKTLICTADHQFFIGEEYKRADKIKKGEVLYERAAEGKAHNQYGRRMGKLWLVWRRGVCLGNPVIQGEACSPRFPLLLQRYLLQTGSEGEDGGDSQQSNFGGVWGNCPLHTMQQTYTNYFSQTVPALQTTVGGEGLLLNELRQGLCQTVFSGEVACAKEALRRLNGHRLAMAERAKSYNDTNATQAGELPLLLQNRYSTPSSQTRDRSRWSEPQVNLREEERCQEDTMLRGVRVESVEIFEPRGAARAPGSSEKGYVYCITVADNHNFFANGVLNHNCMGFCHRCRQLCLTVDKLQWAADYLEGLGTNAVLFYNYISEGEELEKVAKRVLPKGAKVWRIDGKHHDIPTAETIGKYDIVLAQYTSGSASLNLQFMNEMVMVSPNYSYTTSIQARGRIKRIGQKQNMFFWYLVCDDTIETDVYKCLRSKSSFSEEVWTLAQGLELINDTPRSETLL